MGVKKGTRRRIVRAMRSGLRWTLLLGHLACKEPNGNAVNPPGPKQGSASTTTTTPHGGTRTLDKTPGTGGEAFPGENTTAGVQSQSTDHADAQSNENGALPPKGDALPSLEAAPEEAISPPGVQDKGVQQDGEVAVGLQLELVGSRALCTIAGIGDARAPGQEDVQLFGTDLGVTYVHQGRLEWLFGDSWTSPDAGPIAPETDDDDAFGYLELADFAQGSQAETACRESGGLPIRFAVDENDQLLPVHAGPSLDAFKTPVTGFSSGQEEFAFFYYGKPQACEHAGQCGQFECDPSLGYIGVPSSEPTTFTLPCADGTTYLCNPDTVPSLTRGAAPSGYCVDRGSASVSDTPAGRVASAASYLRFGVRKDRRSEYESIPWLTTRFQNLTSTTVRRFAETDLSAADYQPPQGPEAQEASVLLFGRPQFVGTKERNLYLYFAYLPMPKNAREDGLDLRPRFFAGLSAETKQPLFSSEEVQAAPVILDAANNSPREQHNVVLEMSVHYIPALQRFVMLYGGSVSTMQRAFPPRCGVVELFATADCDQVHTGNGAIRLRTATHPWGPWSAPLDILVGGDPEKGPDTNSEYRPSGLLRHPQCQVAGCAPHSSLPNFERDEYGFLYGPNLITPWTVARPDEVDLYWNISTWDPYAVSLIKTTLRRR